MEELRVKIKKRLRLKANNDLLLFSELEKSKFVFITISFFRLDGSGDRELKNPGSRSLWFYNKLKINYVKIMKKMNFGQFFLTKHL